MECWVLLDVLVKRCLGRKEPGEILRMERKMENKGWRKSTSAGVEKGCIDYDAQNHGSRCDIPIL